MLSQSWTELRPHPIQSALWRCKSRIAAVVAGRGSGKTELARRRVVRYLSVKKPWPDPVYFYALPTIPQAKKVGWKKIKSLIPDDWIEDKNETELSIKTVFGSTLYVIGLDQPQRAEGVQYDGGVIDEMSDQKEGVFNTTFLPAMGHRKAWCWLIGVPKLAGPGGPWFKAIYEKGLRGESLVPGVESMRISSFTWRSEGILSEEEVYLAKSLLSQRDYDEQYGASWLNAGGRVFSTFDDDTSVSEYAEYNPELPIIVGSDFNVDPMAWVLCHAVGNQLHVFDEIWLRNTCTQDTLTELYNCYGGHTSGFEFYGDASGKARRSSASSAAQSDYIQIRQDTRFYKAAIYYPDSNPAVVDRFAATNALIRNANGDQRLFIHPRCQYLRKDLLQRSYIKGSRVPDDKGDIGHMTDALGYIVHRKYGFGNILTDGHCAGNIFIQR